MHIFRAAVSTYNENIIYIYDSSTSTGKSDVFMYAYTCFTHSEAHAHTYGLYMQIDRNQFRVQRGAAVEDALMKRWIV